MTYETQEYRGEHVAPRSMLIPNTLHTKLKHLARVSTKWVPVKKVAYEILYPAHGVSPLEDLPSIRPFVTYGRNCTRMSLLVTDLDHENVLEFAQNNRLSASSLYAGALEAYFNIPLLDARTTEVSLQQSVVNIQHLQQ